VWGVDEGAEGRGGGRDVASAGRRRRRLVGGVPCAAGGSGQLAARARRDAAAAAAATAAAVVAAKRMLRTYEPGKEQGERQHACTQWRRRFCNRSRRRRRWQTTTRPPTPFPATGDQHVGVRALAPMAWALCVRVRGCAGAGERGAAAAAMAVKRGRRESVWCSGVAAKPRASLPSVSVTASRRQNRPQHQRRAAEQCGPSAATTARTIVKKQTSWTSDPRCCWKDDGVGGGCGGWNSVVARRVAIVGRDAPVAPTAALEEAAAAAVAMVVRSTLSTYTSTASTKRGLIGLARGGRTRRTDGTGNADECEQTGGKTARTRERA
jgi:hypothetical protein